MVQNLKHCPISYSVRSEEIGRCAGMQEDFDLDFTKHIMEVISND